MTYGKPKRDYDLSEEELLAQEREMDDQPARDYRTFELADTGTRLFALIIDSVILGILSAIVGGLLGLGQTTFLFNFVAGVLYQGYFFTQQDGQTPGKKIMKIRVIKTDGMRLTIADALMRQIGYTIGGAVFGLGYLWALWDENRQGWHDKLAGTYVVHE